VFRMIDVTDLRYTGAWQTDRQTDRRIDSDLLGEWQNSFKIRQNENIIEILELHAWSFNLSDTRIRNWNLCESSPRFVRKESSFGYYFWSLPTQFMRLILDWVSGCLITIFQQHRWYIEA
jgi:hypothetical protein